MPKLKKYTTKDLERISSSKAKKIYCILIFFIRELIWSTKDKNKLIVQEQKNKNLERLHGMAERCDIGEPGILMILILSPINFEKFTQASRSYEYPYSHL